MNEVSLQRADEVGTQYALCIEEARSAEWSTPLPHAVAQASGMRGGVRFFGIGHGENEREARARAVSEWLERSTQFATTDVPIDAYAAFDALGAAAISPAAFGLYHASQYAPRGFPCAPFDPGVPRRWSSVTDASDGSRHLVPIEFVYPSVLPSPDRSLRPLVIETSSGSAAHVNLHEATLAALYEVIERDAVMLCWHREAPARSIPASEDAGAASALRAALIQAGWVTLLLAPHNDLGVPCRLAFALSGTRVLHGSACDADANCAAERAFGELQASLSFAAWCDSPHAPMAHGAQQTPASRSTRSPHAHSARYDGGADHAVLRGMLARVTAAHTACATPESSVGVTASARDRLTAVVAQLRARGYRVFWRDLTPEREIGGGLHVVRVLVPGLIPLSFGAQMLRLGCQRLVGRDSPGRLVSLLPHFFG